MPTDAASSPEVMEAARKWLEDFDRGPWGRKYPAIAQSWRRNWEQVVPFFAFAPELRKILYTTNAIESRAMAGANHLWPALRIWRTAISLWLSDNDTLRKQNVLDPHVVARFNGP